MVPRLEVRRWLLSQKLLGFVLFGGIAARCARPGRQGRGRAGLKEHDGSLSSPSASVN